MLVDIGNGKDDGERYYPLCPYGKKCTYGIMCKYFHRKSRDAKFFVACENRLDDVSLHTSTVQTFHPCNLDGIRYEQELNVEQFEQVKRTVL